MGGTAIKSTQAAAEAAQKTAVIAAKTAHRSHVAAKATATIARKAADYTARAAKAIAQAMQEMISLVAAGGGTVLILVIVLVVMCFAGMMLASDENDMEILPVSEEVKAYEPIIQKYAKEHGIPDYVLLIDRSHAVLRVQFQHPLSPHPRLHYRPGILYQCGYSESCRLPSNCGV